MNGTPPSGWQYVESSNVLALRWALGQYLDVKFKNGSVYRYVGAPLELFWQMAAASSKGQFVWQHLRDRYPTERLA